MTKLHWYAPDDPLPDFYRETAATYAERMAKKRSKASRFSIEVVVPIKVRPKPKPEQAANASTKGR